MKLQNESKKIRVACFGLQGFGNDLLEALRNDPRVEIVALYTRLQRFEFKYYKCPSIEVVAKEMNVPVTYISEKEDWSCEQADLAIVSSFHRIFKKEHLSKFEFAINIHPSLLPSYKGATPTNWMIKDGNVVVGITAHLLDEGIDSGEIIFQQKILNPYLNDNDLRKALSFASRSIVSDIINAFPDYEPSTGSRCESSYFAPRRNVDSVLNYKDITSWEQLIHHIKAFTNFPMAKIQLEDQLFVIDYENPAEMLEIDLENQRACILGHWE